MQEAWAKIEDSSINMISSDEISRRATVEERLKSLLQTSSAIKPIHISCSDKSTNSGQNNEAYTALNDEDVKTPGSAKQSMTPSNDFKNQMSQLNTNDNLKKYTHYVPSYLYKDTRDSRLNHTNSERNSIHFQNPMTNQISSQTDHPFCMNPYQTSPQISNHKKTLEQNKTDNSLNPSDNYYIYDKFNKDMTYYSSSSSNPPQYQPPPHYDRKCIPNPATHPILHHDYQNVDKPFSTERFGKSAFHETNNYDLRNMCNKIYSVELKNENPQSTEINAANTKQLWSLENQPRFSPTGQSSSPSSSQCPGSPSISISKAPEISQSEGSAFHNHKLTEISNQESLKYQRNSDNIYSTYSDQRLMKHTSLNTHANNEVNQNKPLNSNFMNPYSSFENNTNQNSNFSTYHDIKEKPPLPIYHSNQSLTYQKQSINENNSNNESINQQDIRIPDGSCSNTFSEEIQEPIYTQIDLTTKRYSSPNINNNDNSITKTNLSKTHIDNKSQCISYDDPKSNVQFNNVRNLISSPSPKDHGLRVNESKKAIDYTKDIAKEMAQITISSNKWSNPNQRTIYEDDDSSCRSSLSVTPPLPALSPSNTPPVTPPHSPLTDRHITKTPDVVNSTGQQAAINVNKAATKSSTSYLRSHNSQSRKSTHSHKHRVKTPTPTIESLDIMSDDESQSAVEYLIETPTLCSENEESAHNNEIYAIRKQLSNLETMYSRMLDIVGSQRKPRLKHNNSFSSTSTINRGTRYRTHKTATNFRKPPDSSGKINKRFARVESHIVTLARSVAHLSSEMRVKSSHNPGIDEIKKDIKSLKETVNQRSPARSAHHNSDYDRFRGWVPSLSNPKRVNKLTKFFGEEPPLLHIFLKKLGYDRYIQKFDAEKITLVELPYMNEDRLQKIGIPLGPRIRILQEAQMCFRQENFDIYIV